MGKIIAYQFCKHKYNQIWYGIVCATNQLNMFDLYFLPINLINGQEHSELSDLWISAALRRHERTRAGDLLFILLTLSGAPEISSEDTQKLLQNLATTYFRTHGSATAGLRATAELLNNTLLQENLKRKNEGQISAALNLVVLRKETLYIAQAGSTHTFILHQNETLDYHDPQLSARSLGLSRTIAIRYYQAQLKPGDLFILCANPPQHWTTDALTEHTTLPMEQLLRRLLRNASNNLKAAIIQAQTGNGQVKRLKPRAPLASVLSDESTGLFPQAQFTRTPVTASQTSLSLSQASPGKLQEIELEPPPAISSKPASSTTSPPKVSVVPPTSPGIYISGERSSVRMGGQTTPSTNRQVKPTPSFRKQLAHIWFAGKRKLSGLRKKLTAFLNRLTPGEDQHDPLSASTLLFIAIAVPAIIVAIATTVYFQSGPSQQHQIYLEQAKELVIQAGQQEDIVLQRNLLIQADQLLKKAKEYGKSEEANALYLQVQQSLDLMDSVKRIFMQPIITQLDQRIKIKKIVPASNGDVYALDQTSGQVLRITKVGQRYELDEQFICGPGQETDPAMGAVVSIAPIPYGNEFNATVMAVDNNANLLFCVPGDLPLFNPLPEPQTSLSLNATAITVDNGLLYLLDAINKNVWFYTDDITKLNYTQQPHFFFGAAVPENLAKAIDIAVNGEDLYLLRNDGKITWCTYSIDQTRCEDTATLKDMRTGKNGEPVEFTNGKVIQILTTAPPDPSVYLLDQQSVSIYHFSLKLNLQYILQPQQDDNYFIPDEPPSAFAITPDHQVLMAFEYQIFSGALP